MTTTKVGGTSGRPGTSGDLSPPHLLSLTETADLLGCSLKTLRRRVDGGDLPVIRDGRLVRVHPADLARYVAARRSL